MDAGDLLNEDEEIPETVMESAMIKADSMAQIFSHIGVDAVNIGEKDLALGVPRLKELETKWNFPFVSANLVDPNGAPIFKKYVVKDVNGKKVAILGLISDAKEVVSQVEKATGGTVSVQDPLEAAGSIVSELSGKVDYIIALAYQKTTYDWRLARRVEGIDLIVGSLDKTKTEKPTKAGSTLMVRAGEKGQYQGLLEVTFNGEKTDSNSLIPLSEDKPADPEVKAMIAAYNDKIVALYGGSNAGGSSDTTVALRSLSCEPCHTEMVQKWQSSDHAKAYSTLVGKSKQFDPSCLACHTTLFEKPGGFTMKQQQPELMNVQCESCHGLATDHLKDMTSIPVADPPIETCIKCHTADRCPDFEKDYESIWMKIAH